MNIPLQTLNYLFLEQKSGRIHQWSNETLNTLGPAMREKGTQITGPLEIIAMPLCHYAPNIPAYRGRSERISKGTCATTVAKETADQAQLCSQRTASGSSSSALLRPARSS